MERLSPGPSKITAALREHDLNHAQFVVLVSAWWLANQQELPPSASSYRKDDHEPGPHHDFLTTPSARQARALAPG